MVQPILSPTRSARSPQSHSVLGLGWLLVGVLLLGGCTTQAVGGSEASPATSPVASYEAQLAQHLASTGGIMYGAYWCPHCADQKTMFQQAADQVPYVECAADGVNAQPELCQQKGIQGYPTWEIGGQLYPGVKSLDELATMSGFEAPQ